MKKSKKITAVLFAVLFSLSAFVLVASADRVASVSESLPKNNSCPVGRHLDVRENDYVAPTCTRKGFSGGSACVYCGTVIEEPEVIPALHATNPARCVVDDGSYVDNDGDGYCDICGTAWTDEYPPKTSVIDLLLELFHKLFG